MKHMFKLCKVSAYIFDDIERPNPMLNPVGTENWDFK
jgi:hypothetical protein